MDLLPTLAMNISLLLQNYDEWRGGGPMPPTWVTARPITASTRKLALFLISVLVAAASLIALLFDMGWLITALSAALIVNALAQLLASFWTRAVQPGTLSGLVFMLPTSLWAMASVENVFGWVPILAGPVLSVPILVLTWWASIRVTQTPSE